MQPWFKFTVLVAQSFRVRNITGKLGGIVFTGLEGYGAISRTYNPSNHRWTLGSTGYTGTLNFDANDDTQSNADYNNPMATHAVGPDIHPYSMSLMPLIAY